MLLRNFIQNSFLSVSRVSVTPGSGAAGAPAATAEKPLPDPLSDLPEDFAKSVMEVDQDIQQMAKDSEKSGKAAKKVADAKKKAESEEPPAETDDEGKEKETSDESADDNPDEGGEGDDKGKKKDDEEEPAAEAEPEIDENGNPVESTDESEYQDDIIPGLKGKHLEQIPEEVQTILAEHVEKTREIESESKTAKEELEKLKNDPIIKMRLNKLEANDPNYTVTDITTKEMSELLKKHGIDTSLGLDETEIEKLLPAVRDAISARAVELANSHVLIESKKAEVQKTVQAGQDNILALGAFNKDLELKEKNLSKLFELGPKHPEWQKFEKGTLKVIKYLKDKGIYYDKLAKMSPKEIYALTAAGLDMPVALNTTDRDKKIARDAVRKKLSIFKKGGSDTARGLSADSPDGESKIASKAVLDSGYDVVKLATDPAYFEQAYNKKPGDQAWMEKIDKLVEKGERIARSRGKPKPKT
jgi:hypothetical protein